MNYTEILLCLCLINRQYATVYHYLLSAYALYKRFEQKLISYNAKLDFLSNFNVSIKNTENPTDMANIIRK